jgi:WD40 repeat protein
LAAGKTMITLTHHKKSVRALAIHPTEYSFASGSAGGNNIKKWKCPEGTFVFNFSGHDAIINTMSVNAEGVFFSAGEFLLSISSLLDSSLSAFFYLIYLILLLDRNPYANLY